LISSILDEAADVTEKTTEIKEKIGGIIETKKGDASQMMNDKITETLAASGMRPWSRPDCLWPPSFVARQVLAADGLGLTRNDMFAVSSGDVPVPEGVPGPDADEMKSGLEEMIKNIGEQVTRIAVSKMDTTTTTLIAVIGSVLDQLAVVRCLPAFLPFCLPVCPPFCLLARPPACLPLPTYVRSCSEDHRALTLSLRGRRMIGWCLSVGVRGCEGQGRFGWIWQPERGVCGGTQGGCTCQRCDAPLLASQARGLGCLRTRC